MGSVLKGTKEANAEVNRKNQTQSLILDIKDADPLTQKNITFVLRRDAFGTGPRNAEELYKMLDVCYGIRLGVTATSPDFISPMEWADAFFFERYPQLLTVGGRGSGKALSLDTPIPGLNGWTTMGGIEVGDIIFDETGKPTRVTFVTDVMHGHDCYEVEFTDGTKIVADAEHLWFTLDNKWRKRQWNLRKGRNRGIKKPIPYRGVKTTKEIADTLTIPAGKVRKDLNHNIPLCGAVQYSTKEQPVDPYVLGIWLGDGSSGCGRFNSADQEIVDAVSAKFDCEFKGIYEYATYGLRTHLAKLQLLNNKHIPDCYLYGSIEQRLALLQGLMDSDGTVEKNGTCNIGFCHNTRLITQTQELILSLGIKTNLTTKRAMLYEKDCGVCYRLHFTPKDIEVFRLTRKRERQRLSLDRNSPYGKSGRFVKAVTKVDSVPVRCITVDSPSHLYLCSKSFIPTHNTLPAGAMIHAKCSHRPDYTCVHVAANLDQSQALQRYLANWGDDNVLNKGLDRKNIGKKRAHWESTNSTWWIATGSMAGVSSNHPAMLSLDELEFADWAMVEQSWAVPMDRDGHKRMWAGFSTRQRASSTMSKLTNMAETGERNIKLMQWTVFETMKPCPSCLCIKGGQTISEPEKACPLWKYCHGERAMKATGWQTREAVVNLMSTMSQDSFETQMLSMRPPSHGLVLHNFIQDYASLLDMNKGNFIPWEYQPDLPVYAFHDPAETKVAALLLVQIYQNKVFAFDEIVDDTGPTTSKTKEDLENLCAVKGYAIPKVIIVDPRRTDIVKQWKEGSLSGTGITRSFNATVPKMNHGMDDIEPGLELLRSFIRNGIGEISFYINPHTCKKFVTAMTNNRYKLNKQNELESTAKQENKFKDEVDCVRYGLIYLRQQVIPLHRSGFGF